jgi:hypothetical protein
MIGQEICRPTADVGISEMKKAPLEGTVMVVDENEKSRALVVRVLQRMGFTLDNILLCSFQEQAISSITAGVGLVIYDVDPRKGEAVHYTRKITKPGAKTQEGVPQMPELSAVCKGSNIPIIFLTSLAYEKVAEEYEFSDDSGFIKKGSSFSSDLEANLRNAVEMIASNRAEEETQANHA